MPRFDITTGSDLLDALTATGIAAANAIRDCRQDGKFRSKADGSPVTGADEAAEAVILERLAALAPTWPVISEERAERERPGPGPQYFLVDPLDGTREFLGGRVEYTVNIGLVADGTPILGVIVAPALGLIWRGRVGHGAERLEFAPGRAGTSTPIRTRARPDGELIVMVSRSHLDPRTQAYLDTLPHTHRIACGSSLKFCRLAEGAADHYPRLGATRDWDIAAGQAVLVAAGGSVIDPDGAALTYGTPELRIPAFLAWAGPAPTEGALKAAW